MQETLYRKNHNSRIDLFEEQERLVELEGNMARYGKRNWSRPGPLWPRSRRRRKERSRSSTGERRSSRRG